MLKVQALLSPLIRDVLREVYASLQEIYRTRLRRLILFGSYARGEARPESDVDLLVVLDGPVDPLEEARRTSRLALRAAAHRDTMLSFLHLSEEEFADDRRPLVRSIREEGIDLTDRIPPASSEAGSASPTNPGS